MACVRFHRRLELPVVVARHLLSKMWADGASCAGVTATVHVTRHTSCVETESVGSSAVASDIEMFTLFSNLRDEWRVV